MTLVIDACSLLNLTHCVGDDSFIKAINTIFSKVYITSKVEEEVNSNFIKYAYIYDYNKQSIHDLQYSLSLERYRSEFEKDKDQGKELARNYGIFKKKVFKESSGEFESLLLSLHVSRLGETDFNENLNKVFFATDDAPASEIFSSFFSENHVGKIIDSVDILTLLYLKSKITKTDLVKNIYAIKQLYLRPMNILVKYIEKIKAKENLNSDAQLRLTIIHKLLNETNLEELIKVTEDPKYRKLLLKFPLIKDPLQEIMSIAPRNKISYLNYRISMIDRNLLWKF